MASSKLKCFSCNSKKGDRARVPLIRECGPWSANHVNGTESTCESPPKKRGQKGVKMAAGKGDSKSAPTKRGLRDVISTPGKSTSSPMRKQLRKAIEEGSNDEVNSSDSLKSEIPDVISAVLDTKLEGLVTRIESMMTAKIQELEVKFESIQSEVKQLKQEVNESINHVEDVLKYDIDQVWEYAVKNEQYSRKNNLRILGLDEEEGENLEQKFSNL